MYLPLISAALCPEINIQNKTGRIFTTSMAFPNCKMLETAIFVIMMSLLSYANDVAVLLSGRVRIDRERLSKTEQFLDCSKWLAAWSECNKRRNTRNIDQWSLFLWLKVQETMQLAMEQSSTNALNQYKMLGTNKVRY